MQVLIVHDEPLVCSALATVLKKRSDVDGFDFTSDPTEAFERLQTSACDVLVLDIDLPNIGGVELLERLRRSDRTIPSVIFVTASPEHAITAFEKQAVDYLLKPFSEDRISQALDRAIQVTAGQRAAKLLGFLTQLTLPGRSALRRIGIKEKRRFVFVDPSEVVTIHAEGNYVLLKKENGSHLLRQTISEIGVMLEHYGFIRIHRSILVNKSFVEEIVPHTKGEYGLRMKGGKEYSVTRTYRNNLKSLATSWFGTTVFDSE